MTFREVQIHEVLDVQWGDTKTTKSSYVDDGYLAYSATGPDGFLPKFDYDCDGVVLSAIGANCGSTFFATNKWSCIKNTIRILPRSPDIDLKYFYFMTKSPNFWPLRGSAQPFISQTDIREMVIKIPEMAIQRKIGEIIYGLELSIQKNGQIAETLEEIAQAIFKSWFIDFDPVKAKMTGDKPFGMDDATAALFPDSMEESEIGQVPKGWRNGALKDVLTNVKGMVKASAFTESLPYVPIDKITSKSVFLKESSPGVEAKSSLVSFERNDILFGAMRPYFHKVCLAPFKGTTRTTTFVLRPNDMRFLMFSLFVVFQDDAIDFATNSSQGSTIPYATWSGNFDSFQLVIPSAEVAKRFTEITLPLMELGYSLIMENQHLVAARDCLLPRLISGELQIPEEMLVL
jgi:type I restriction enzyme S subunit